MKSVVELVKRVDDQNRPYPMDLGSFAEAQDHTEYVYWSDQGAPSGQRAMMGARPNALRDNIHGKMVNPIAWPPLPRQADAPHQHTLDAINGKGGK